MQKTNSSSSLDQYQRPVVEANEGHHLVLAPPGCGKTHILASRISYARSKGIKFEDMLCLTFTNRAAREMTNRVQTMIKEDASDLMIGNVHRFCSKFLFEQKKIPSDSSIIDEEEAVSIIADYKTESEEGIMGNYQRYRGYQSIILFQHFAYQIEHKHPWKYFLHPESFSDADREAMKFICNRYQMEYDQDAIIKVYNHAQDYIDEMNDYGGEAEMRGKIWQMLQKMYYASCYAKYKEENHLLDFEDLLLKTYDVYSTEPNSKHYSWVQVDEVQDLNSMQLAIIDLLSTKDAMVMYLGDEQQAIFSFMGAKMETLTLLKMRCKGNIHHLRRNHRSPKYLLDVFNDYATKVLHIDAELLPAADNNDVAKKGDLAILHSNFIDDEIDDVIKLTRSLYNRNSQEKTAVIVSSNTDADKISGLMSKMELTHFKVSGKDIFDTTDFKLLLAHLNILNNEHNSIAWTRIMKGVKVFPSHSLARRFNWKLKQLALSPTDLILYNNSSYTAEFLKAYEQYEVIVFDTETTGLDVYHDDIIEISAMRVKRGEIVGEVLDLYIRTEKPILPKLGDKENPMYGIYHEKEASNELIEPKEALQKFIAFIGDKPILAHNANYDYNILDNCLNRYCGHRLAEYNTVCFDSLKLMHLLAPGLHSYRLELLIEKYGLQGKNSHQAIDDVEATVSLMRLCAKMASKMVDQQLNFIRHEKVKPYINKLKVNYGEFYKSIIGNLYKLNKGSELALSQALGQVYFEFLNEHFIDKIDRIEYVVRYLEMDMLTNKEIPNALQAQLNAYTMELNTLKESDFCNSKSIRERIYVTTVHKAKGLEFDNVIVFDVAKGRYPNAYNKTKQQDEEDARKLYVAMSRAQRRLFIAFAMQMVDRYGRVFTRELSPLLNDIQKWFS